MNSHGHIFLASPHMSGDGYEQEYIKEAFHSNWIAPLGKNVTEFEREIEEKTGAKKAVALSSGTAAIHIALKAAGVEEGDIVFCQSLTFAATANPIAYEKAVPVFIDSEEETWNMSPIALRKAFEKYEGLGRRPKAVIAVHLYGNCAKIEEIASICKEHSVPLVEDAAESLGTVHKRQYTGTFGDYGIYSFNGNKIITTSGGGMLLVNTGDAEAKARKALFWATQARDAAKWYQHSEIGYNYRMSNVLAGIGRGQLKVLDRRVEKKRHIYGFYKERLGGAADIRLMPRETGKDSRNNCWLTAIQLLGERKPLEVIGLLEKADIESRPIWKPLHLQPVFQEFDFIARAEKRLVIDEEMGADNSVAGEIFSRGLCLPSDTKMSDMDLERVCSIILGN